MVLYLIYCHYQRIIIVYSRQLMYSIQYFNSIIYTHSIVMTANTNYGKIVSFLILICYMTVLPYLLKLIWPSLLDILHHDAMYLYILIALAVNTLVFGIYNLVMWYIYTAKIPFLQQYRDSMANWPWEADPAKWKQFLHKTIKSVLINIYLISFLFPIFQYKVLKSHYQSSLEQWPSTFTLFLQFTFFLFMQDATFYWTHYAFHRYLYSIHKQHHQYTITVSISATYAHPVQFIFGNILPTGIGYLILGRIMQVHYVSICVWLVFRTVQGSQVHSGYNWSWRQLAFVPGKSGPEHHDFHHSHNVGNFGSMFQFWDSLMKTNIEYNKVQNKIKNQ